MTRSTLPRASALDRGAEVFVALALPGWFISYPGPRALLLGGLVALVDGARSFPGLLATDTWAALVTLLGALAKLCLVVGPAVRVLAEKPRHRLAWIPATAVVTIIAIPMLHAAVATPTTALLLLMVGVGAWWVARRPALRPLALSPILLVFEPALSHSPLGDVVWTASRLAPRCAENDGARPQGFEASRARTRYYAVTPHAGELLLTGDQGSAWLARRDGGWAFGPPSRVRGNYWRGCELEGSLWMSKRGRIVRVNRLDPSDPAVERVEEHIAPAYPGVELDFTTPACSPATRSVFVGELVRGGLLELDVGTGEYRRHTIGGFHLQLWTRNDGKIVGIDSARLFLFDPLAREVVDSVPVGITAIGAAVCAVDGAAVVTDMAGRLRLFELDTHGRYRFAGGTFLAAPRRVAFSPRCDRIAVGSGDDRTVYVLRRRGLDVERRFRIGPALRDVAFVGDDELVAVDACTATSLDLSPLR